MIGGGHATQLKGDAPLGHLLPQQFFRFLFSADEVHATINSRGGRMHLNLSWAALGGATLGSLADWLFAGALFQGRYLLHPEVWRATSNDTRRVMLAELTTLPTAGGLTLLTYRLGATHWSSAFELAGMIWLIAPLPLHRQRAFHQDRLDGYGKPRRRMAGEAPAVRSRGGLLPLVEMRLLASDYLRLARLAGQHLH
jgi:hypothetical protein